MAKNSKEKSAPSALSSTAERLNTLLQKATSAHSAAENGELLYQLEKYGRELADDEDQNVAAYHFKRAVDNLYDLAHLQHDQGQVLQLSLSSGQTYAALGLMDEAKTRYEQAMKLSSELGDELMKARTLRLLGNLHLQQADAKAAVSHFKKSIDICQENGELLEEAYSLNSLSAAYFQIASWRKMEQVCDQALNIAERLGEEELSACVYNNLGAMHSLRGQWQKALVAFQKCLPLFEMAGDYRGLAETYNNMATLCRDQDLWHEAGKCYAQSLRFADQAGDTLAKANAMLNRVELYILMYDLELARENCLKAMHTFHKMGQKFGEADACKLMGVIYTKDEKWNLAEKYFEEALETSQSCKNLLGLAECYRSYGEFYIEQEDTTQAIRMLEKSAENFRLLKATRKAKKVEKKMKDLRKELE